MSAKKIFIAITVLALAAMACSLNINLPINTIKTGPTVTDKILVAELDDPDEVARVELAFGAGRLDLAPGAEDALISGTATYNVEQLKPVIDVSGNRVRIEIDKGFSLDGIPNLGDRYRNEWDLMLSDAPMELTISAGAYDGDFDLGGLALHSLEVNDGAANVDLRFSEPNQVEMDEFRYRTGASDIELLGLANANFERMEFRGGAGNYTLDFSGELARDADVTVDLGFSSLRIVVPEGVNARVLMDSALSNVDITGVWEKTGDDYVQEGSGPRLTINVNMGAGNLDLGN